MTDEYPDYAYELRKIAIDQGDWVIDAANEIELMRLLGDQLFNTIQKFFPDKGMPEEVAILLANWELLQRE